MCVCVWGGEGEGWEVGGMQYHICGLFCILEGQCSYMWIRLHFGKSVFTYVDNFGKSVFTYVGNLALWKVSVHVGRSAFMYVDYFALWKVSVHICGYFFTFEGRSVFIYVDNFALWKVSVHIFGYFCTFRGQCSYMWIILNLGRSIFFFTINWPEHNARQRLLLDTCLYGRLGGDGGFGGFSFACEDFGRMFDHSFLA